MLIIFTLQAVRSGNYEKFWKKIHCDSRWHSSFRFYVDIRFFVKYIVS